MTSREAAGRLPRWRFDVSKLGTWMPALVFAVGFAVYYLSTGGRHVEIDNYVRLAYSLVHGHLWIDPGRHIETVVVDSLHYTIEGPMPAVLCIPFVIAFGPDASQGLVCAMVAALGLALAWIMLGRMRVSEPVQVWTTILLGFGTVYWWCAAFGSLWMYAHVTAVMFALLGLAEWYGRRRPWLLGMIFSFMTLSRFAMGLAAVPFLMWLVAETPRGARLRAVGLALAGALPFLLLYLWYDYARWDTLYDIGYSLWYHNDPVLASGARPFDLRWLPGNLYSLFMLSPPFDSQFPWLRPTIFGVALTFTSPALALAFFAPAKQRETIYLWMAVALVALPSLLYYVNGYEQFGMRHSLDFTPFLLPLVARGMERLRLAVAYGLIGYSVLANAYGLWYSWTYYPYGVVPRW